MSIDPEVEEGETSYTAYESNGTSIASVMRVCISRDAGDTYWETVAFYQYDNLEDGSNPNWADEVKPRTRSSQFSTPPRDVEYRAGAGGERRWLGVWRCGRQFDD